MKTVKAEFSKLRLYFTGGRDLVQTDESVKTQPILPNGFDENSTISNLRCQIEALQHIIDIQEHHFRTIQPQSIPSLAMLEKWRRVVFETMVRHKIETMGFRKHVRMLECKVENLKGDLGIINAKIRAKDIEINEMKNRYENSKKVIEGLSDKEKQLQMCVQTLKNGIRSLLSTYKEKTNSFSERLYAMTRRLDLANTRIKQFSGEQKSVSVLEHLLEKRNGEKNSLEMRLVEVNEANGNLKRQLQTYDNQVQTLMTQRNSLQEQYEYDKKAERETNSIHLRALTSELTQLRIEHASTLRDFSALKTQLEESESNRKKSIDELGKELTEAKLDYESLVKVARQHGILEEVTSRKLKPGLSFYYLHSSLFYDSL